MRSVMTKAVLAAALMGLTANPLSAASEHDGKWTVRVITVQGGCDRVSNYDVSVANGLISYASYSSVSLSGRVSPQGEVMVSIRHHDDFAQGSGRLNEQ